MKTCCNTLLACVLVFYQNNVGRFFLPHTAIWVDVTMCFWPISCVCSVCMCQVAFELYHSSAHGTNMQQYTANNISGSVHGTTCGSTQHTILVIVHMAQHVVVHRVQYRGECSWHNIWHGSTQDTIQSGYVKHHLPLSSGTSRWQTMDHLYGNRRKFASFLLTAAGPVLVIELLQY